MVSFLFRLQRTPTLITVIIVRECSYTNTRSKTETVSLPENPPIPDPGCASLTLGALPLMHVRPIGAVHISAIRTFGLVGILIFIGPLYPAMTAALLAIGVEITDFSTLTAPIQPLNTLIKRFHLTYPFFERPCVIFHVLRRFALQDRSLPDSGKAHLFCSQGSSLPPACPPAAVWRSILPRA